MSRLVLSQITIKKERSISSTTWYYLLQPSNASAPDSTNYGNPPPTYSTTGYSGWSTTEPTYTVGDNRVLYIMVKTLYSDNTFSYSTPTISSSYEAAKDAYNETIQAEQDILELQNLGLSHGYIWDNTTYAAATNTIPVYPVGSYIASGILVDGSRTITRNNSNTYGLNTWISSGGINLRYNAIDLMKLTTSNLEFYYPSTSSQGTKAISLGTNGAINSLAFYGFNNSNKTMELTNNGLYFYNPSDGSTELASFTIDGLVLNKGGIKAGCNYHIEAINNPSSENLYYYYELINNNYVKTEDEEIISGKTYYAYELDDPTQEQYIYMSTEDFPVVTTVGAGIDKNDWRLLVGTKFGVDNTGNLYAYGGQIGNENSYINISEHGINIINSNLDISIESLNTAVQSTEWNQNHIVYELTNDSSIMYIIVEKPVLKDIGNYYELNNSTYSKTSDTKIIKNKIYYTQKNYYQLINEYKNTELIYLPVENPIIDNKENYYEFNGNTYIKTQDTDIIKGKTYYIFDSDRDYYVVNEGIQVIDPIDSELNDYYELNNNIYIKTQDTTVVVGKEYYRINFKIAELPDDSGPYYEYIIYQNYDFQSGETNPKNLDLYEITGTESIVDFIGTHFNFTKEGLYVSDSLSSDYKLLVGSDGVYIYNADGVISKFGENIEFTSSQPQRIGGDTSYIQFTPTIGNIPEHIDIVARSIIIGDNDIDSFITNTDNQLDSTQSQLGEQQDQISAQSTIFSEYAAATDEKIEAAETQLAEQQILLNQQSEDLSNLTGYVEIKAAEGIIRVGKKDVEQVKSYVEIDGYDAEVSINIDKKKVAYMSGSRFYAPSAVVTNLYMKTQLTGNDPTGSIGWVMRSNGHLSLKRIV